MPLVYCDSSIVDYESPKGIIVPVQPETQQSQAQSQVLGALRPTAQRNQATQCRKIDGELSTVVGPAAHGVCPRVETAGLPPPPAGEREAGSKDGVLPLLPTPPPTAPEDFQYTLKLHGLPQLTARRPGALGATPRATVLAGSQSAREMRLQAGKSKRVDLKKSRSARGSHRASVREREPDGRGQRRLQGARRDASAIENPEADMIVRSEYTGIERNLMEWAVEPQGYSEELQRLQEMQTGFDLDRMRTAELMAHINTKHNSMKEFETRSGDGFWDRQGRWKPTPLIASIRRYAWTEAAQLLKWSLVGAEMRRASRTLEDGKRSPAKKNQGQQSYERPDYSVDTDQNANTALHHCLAPYQADLSFKRGTKANSWHPKGSKGAVGTRNRPPPEFLTALIQANPAAVGARNRNGLTPLHFALGCTTTEINASVETIIEMCEAYPEAVRVKNNTAELPLHLAAAKNAPERLLRKLIQMHPDACFQANCWGSLPIHVGLVNGMPESQVRILIEACPSTVVEVDEDGRTPCAIALTTGAPASTIMFLVREYPECLSIRDANGLSPLALALVGQAPEATVLQLLECFPKAVLLESSHTLEVPLHVAIRHAQRNSKRFDRADSPRGSSSRGSRRRRDDSRMPSGLRRTGQCWPIQYRGQGDGFHVPPSRGGLLPIQRGHGEPNNGSHSRGNLVTPSMNFTPQSLQLPEVGLGAGAGVRANASVIASSAATGITVSSGVDFAPGSLELPTVFGLTDGERLLKNMSSRRLPMHKKDATIKTQAGSNSGVAMARPFSTGTEGRLERIVTAFLAADEDLRKNMSSARRDEAGITQGRTIEAVDLHGRTPLHTACIRQVPNSVIKLLVASNPEAVAQKDHDGWVPLHRYLSGPAYAAAEDSLLSVLTLLEPYPELGNIRHAPVSIERLNKQAAQQDKLNETRIRDEMMATGLYGYEEQEKMIESGVHKPQPPSSMKKTVYVSSGRRAAMEGATRKRRVKAGLFSKLSVVPGQSSDKQTLARTPVAPVPDQAIENRWHAKDSVKLHGPTDTMADPRQSRTEEQARLGRALTRVEGLNRLKHMKEQQQTERAIHEAKIKRMKWNRCKGVESELFPYELAEKHRSACLNTIGPKAAKMSEHVVQLLKALVVPSQKVLSSDARVEDEGQDNPVLILDRNIEEAEVELREALAMLHANHDAGVLLTMPPRVTARLEKEHAYCAKLVKELAVCRGFAEKHEWERLAVHCDELLHSPESRNSRILKVIEDEANNQIELACIRMFKRSQESFAQIGAKMEKTSTQVEKAKARHDVVIREGFGTGVRPYGHATVHVI